MQAAELSGRRLQFGGHLFGHAIKLVAGPVSAALFIFAVVGIGGLWWMFKRFEAQLLAEGRRALWLQISGNVSVACRKADVTRTFPASLRCAQLIV